MKKKSNANTVLLESAPANGDTSVLPLFVKQDAFWVLIVGGGSAGLQQLKNIIEKAPATNVKLVSEKITEAVKTFAASFPNIKTSQKPFGTEDLDSAAVVIIAVENSAESDYIRTIAKEGGKLVHVAGRPEQSDFYIGAPVQNDNFSKAVFEYNQSYFLEMPHQENGAEWLTTYSEEQLPLEENKHPKPTYKLKPLYYITKRLAPSSADNSAEAYWRRIATYCLFAFFFMFLGHFILSYVPLKDIWSGVREIGGQVDERFYWMIAAGFLAQLVDGALGMGYGVTCTTVLLSMGVSLPAISSSIHTAEMFSSGMSGYTHYRFGNVNKKLFKALLIPGIIGAVGGAVLLSKFGESNAEFIKPLLATYTLILGLRILLTAFKKKRKSKKVKRVGWLAGAGGFLDSFGGGGWGPLVTSTLISKGRTPKYAIGSVSITEFFVTLSSTITFFVFLGVSHWQIIAGLIIGGMLAAPLAAKLVGKLPLKTMLIAVGIMVMFWSLHILIRAVW
ncbi:MAG: TSUP family transporter [Chitinophagaceae bacterium]